MKNGQHIFTHTVMYVRSSLVQVQTGACMSLEFLSVIGQGETREYSTHIQQVAINTTSSECYIGSMTA